MMTADGFDMAELFDGDENFIQLVKSSLGVNDKFFMRCAESQLGKDWKQIGAEIIEDHLPERLKEYEKLVNVDQDTAKKD